MEGRAAAKGAPQEPTREPLPVPPLEGGEGNRQGKSPGARGGGAPPPNGGSGSGDGGSGHSLDSGSDEDNNADDMDVDPNKEEPEDPSDRQAGKTYKARTEGGKAMAKMLRNLCRLTKADAHAIVVYFGVYGENRLAEFQESHWKDTFAQWQKRQMCPDGKERAMVLSPPQQDCIQYAAWACQQKQWLGWLQTLISPRDLAVQMIERLSKEHFEAIRAQIK